MEIKSFVNLDLDEVRFAEAVTVDGEYLIEVKYYGDKPSDFISYNEEDLSILAQMANANRVKKNIKIKVDERVKTEFANKKQVVPVPGTERTYTDATHLSPDEYAESLGRALDRSSEPVKAETNTKKKEKANDHFAGKLALAMGGAALCAVTLFVVKNHSSLFGNSDKTADTTIETEAEETAIELGNIQAHDEIDFYTGVNDVNNAIDIYKKRGYFNEERDNVLTEQAIQAAYFTANVSEMSTDTQNRFVRNRIVRDSSKEIIDDTRELLEIVSVEDDNFVDGRSGIYFDLSPIFKDAEAQEIYRNYTNALLEVRKAIANNDTAAAQEIYAAVEAWSRDCDSELLGNPKSVNYGVRYIMNNLIRRNILGSLYEKGLVKESQYDYITGPNENGEYTEIKKTNDIVYLLGYACGEDEATIEETITETTVDSTSHVK